MTSGWIGDPSSPWHMSAPSHTRTFPQKSHSEILQGGAQRWVDYSKEEVEFGQASHAYDDLGN